MNNISKNEYPSSSTVWALYRLLPDYVIFGIEVIRECDNTVIESLEFCKNDEQEKKLGQKQMYSLLRRCAKYEYYSINFKWRWGLGSDAIIQIVLW